MRRAVRIAAAGCVVFGLALAYASAAGQQGQVTTYTLPTRGVPLGTPDPQGITSGPDGNVWFTEAGANEIVKITPAGQMTHYQIPTAYSHPLGIAAGPDGNLWFTEEDAGKIGRITPAGAISEFSLPRVGPAGIVAGPDGNLWFTEYGADAIGRITTKGVVSSFPIPGGRGNDTPNSIAVGADGNLWFTEELGGQVGRITPSGRITRYRPAARALLYGIASGQDGNLWFAEEDRNGVQKIGRITPAGTFAAYPIPGDLSVLRGVVKAPDGNVWFVIGRGSCDAIGRVTPSGSITQYPTGGTLTGMNGLAVGGDHNLWFTEVLDGAVARMISPSTLPPPSWNAAEERASVHGILATAAGAVRSSGLTRFAHAASVAVPVRWLSAETLLIRISITTSEATKLGIKPSGPGPVVLAWNEYQSHCAPGSSQTAVALTGQARTPAVLRGIQGTASLPVKITATISDTTSSATVTASATTTLQRR
ncbi:MAG: Vgb family protein [Solirubrobacteraceae bacterium]